MIQVVRGWFGRSFSDPQLLILATLLVVGFLLVYLLGKMLTPVFAAVVIAYLLDGMVEVLVRRRVPRLIAAGIVFVFFVAAVLVVLVGLLPILSGQVAQLLSELPAMVSRGQASLMLLPERYPELIGPEQVQSVISFVSREITALGQKALSWSIASVRSAITVLVYLILVPLLVFFFLKDKNKILDWLSGLLPDERRLAMDVWHEVNQEVSNYVRGKIWEILIVWAVSYAAFKVIDLDYALLLAVFVGLSVIVPYIGATVMFLPVGVIGYLQWGWGSEFLTAMAVYTVIQILDGNLLVPLLLSEVVNLHPVAIIVAVLIFGGWWGVWGLFFAIPLATLVHAVLKAWLGVRRKRLPEEQIRLMACESDRLF